NLASALLLHDWHNSFTAQPEALDVDRHHPIPFGFWDLLKGGELQAPIDGSIIDQDIDSPEVLDGLGCHRLGTLSVGDVYRGPQRLTTGLLDLRHGLRTRQDVRGDDVGALACQGEAVRLSDPTGRPRDNGHAIFESHMLLPPVVSQRPG